MKKSFLFLSVIFVFIFNSLFADTIYTVVKGDTLYSISRKYQVSIDDIRTANNLSENDVIKADQKLKIPEANNGSKKTNSTTTSSSTEKKSSKSTDTYTIEKGDTLYGIAKKFNVSIDTLLELNNLTKESVIKAGQTIKVSGVGSSSKKTDTTTNKKDEPKKTEVKVTEDKPVESVPDVRTYGKTLTADTSTKWPVQNPTVTQVKGKVSGVQLSALSNEAVTCIHEGTVMYVGTYRGFGQVVFVQSKTGLIYSYSGLGSVKVRKGDYTISGTELGTAGIDSITGNPQITFMVFQNGQPIDPKTAPRS